MSSLCTALLLPSLPLPLFLSLQCWKLKLGSQVGIAAFSMLVSALAMNWIIPAAMYFSLSFSKENTCSSPCWNIVNNSCLWRGKLNHVCDYVRPVDKVDFLALEDFVREREHSIVMLPLLHGVHVLPEPGCGMEKAAGCFQPASIWKPSSTHDAAIIAFLFFFSFPTCSQKMWEEEFLAQFQNDPEIV